MILCPRSAWDEAGPPRGRRQGRRQDRRIDAGRDDIGTMLRRRDCACSLLAAAALLTAAALLNGCAAAGVGDSLPPELGGLPRNAPARPADPGAFPAVHDMPAPRSDTVLTPEEQSRLERDLKALRDRQEGQAGQAAQDDGAAAPAGASSQKRNRAPRRPQSPAGTGGNP